MIYGLQFHLEVDEADDPAVAKGAENRHEIAKLHSGIDPDRIHAEIPQYIGRLHELSEQTFSQFMDFSAGKSFTGGSLRDEPLQFPVSSSALLGGELVHQFIQRLHA